MRRRAQLVLLAALAGLAQPALALRPFEGTDASVAEPFVFELELGPLSYIRQGGMRSAVAPAIVGNFGLPHDFELVLEGRARRQLGDTADRFRTRFSDTALSVKHVLREGSLQEGGTGVSVAAECGLLLHEVHGEQGTGSTCAAIASQRFEPASVHLNGAVSRTRDQHVGRFLGVIVAGEGESPVHPVMELFVERDNNGGHTRSALLGMLWRQSEELVFDAGIRSARTDGERLLEVKVGLTWSYAFHKQ